MATVAVYNMDGVKTGSMEVSDSIFAAEVNKSVLHTVVTNYLANQRQGTQSTKTRTEVRGGGIKPWRQKGTGRARQGSIRSPQWRHGGVVFAPKPRDFSKKINKAMKAAAMVSVLSQKVRQDEIVVLDKIELAEAKTKEMAKICEALNAGKKALFVLGSENEKVVRATNNLPEATVCDATLINVYDLVRAGKVFVTEEAIKVIEEARV